jgi:hypothetical protein
MLLFIHFIYFFYLICFIYLIFLSLAHLICIFWVRNGLHLIELIN